MKVTVCCEKVIEVDDKFEYLLNNDGSDDPIEWRIYALELFTNAQKALKDVGEVLSVWDEKGECLLVEP